ncbi:MAG: hypothetical protein JKY70_22535 [Mucilaginibacter sp.]|nr:hypothetical protein [Mucilaginibacter sp.]
MTDVHAYPDPMLPIKQNNKAQVVGEFGGIGVFIPDHQWNTNTAWGYIQEKPADLKTKYTIMTQHLQLLQKQGLSGSIYTQPYDVEGEQNGLMTYDREVIKVPFKDLQKIHQPLDPDANTNVPEPSIQNADLTDPAEKYRINLQQYIDGNHEPDFLKKLLLQASQAGDQEGKTIIGTAYIATLTAPLSDDDIRLVAKYTNTVKDNSYQLVKQDTAGFQRVLGKRPYTVKMMNMVYAGIMAPLIDGKTNPDWDAITNAIKPYGAAGEEMLLRAETVHFLNKQDWKSFKPVAMAYLNKYGANIKPEEKTMFENACKNAQ